ncbi:gluconokinase [Jeotgalibacillus salarius]|uniref:Gluconate kinase n=1 Tax=Jeotgalibacillus salarius TaxID=546023 RepID=A0A4Y8LBK0_9BACL|nr:gluconokinase [Jeotgalibacillus salarius]TFD98430.1 gluconate kinase [Jeotgalibacillus salarius]
MNKRFVIGLDIGTTSAKAVVFDRSGHVISEHEEGYPTLHEQPSWSEQDPLSIEQAAITSIRLALQYKHISPDEIISVGLSSAMHSLICADEHNEPISPLITWADRRSIKQADELKASPEGENIYLKSGTPIHPMSPLIKLIWMKENQYTPYLNAAKFLSIKEFLTSRWFGIDAVDYSIASATGLFNIHTRSWNHEALKLASIEESQLSKPVPASYIFNGLKPQIAEAMGLNCDTPFAAGGSDGPLANLGIGAIEPGEAAITIGTSGAIRQMSKAPHTDRHQETFCYAFTDDLWVLGGPTNNGGNVLKWLKDVLGHEAAANALQNGEDPSALLIQSLEEIEPGAGKLLFLPYLSGERAPHWDANAKGAFVGLTVNHTHQHMVKAGLEGVLFNILTIKNSLERLTGDTKSIYASGGFARSKEWVQMMADIFGKEIKLPLSHQSSSWGAAWISLHAVGEAANLTGIKDKIPMTDAVYPDLEKHKRYQEIYPIFQNVYDALKPTFHDLSKLQ